MARWGQALLVGVLAVVLALAVGRSGAAGMAVSPPSPISPLPSELYLPVVRVGPPVLPVYLPLVWR